MGGWDGTKFSVEDGLFGFIKFTDGSCLQVKTSFALHMAEKEERNVCLYGDKKGLSVFPAELYGDEGGRQFNTVYPFEESRDWHYDCIRNFVESCMGRAEVLVKPEQAVYVQKLINGLYRSAKTGEPVFYRNKGL